MEKNKVSSTIHRIYPFVVGLLIMVCFIYLKIDYSIKNLEKILESIITFVSIVLGFLGALLGILITIKDSDVMKEITTKNEKNTLKQYFNDAFSSGFTLLVLSIFSFNISYYHEIVSLILFYVWLFISFAFVFCSFRIIKNLMEIFFVSDSNLDKRPEGNEIKSPEERAAIKEELTKK